MVKIRFQNKKINLKTSLYRIVVVDTRSKINGKNVAYLGTIKKKELINTETITVVDLKTDLLLYWISKGAQISSNGLKLLNSINII